MTQGLDGVALAAQLLAAVGAVHDHVVAAGGGAGGRDVVLANSLSLGVALGQDGGLGDGDVKGLVLEHGAVSHQAVLSAGGLADDLGLAVGGLGLDVARVGVAGAGGGDAAVVVGPDVADTAPVVAGGLDGDAVGIVVGCAFEGNGGDVVVLTGLGAGRREAGDLVQHGDGGLRDLVVAVLADEGGGGQAAVRGPGPGGRAVAVAQGGGDLGAAHADGQLQTLDGDLGAVSDVAFLGAGGLVAFQILDGDVGAGAAGGVARIVPADHVDGHAAVILSPDDVVHLGEVPIVAGGREHDGLGVGVVHAVHGHGGGEDGLSIGLAFGVGGLAGDDGVLDDGVLALAPGGGGGGVADDVLFLIQLLGPIPGGSAKDVQGDLDGLFRNGGVVVALKGLDDDGGVEALVLVIVIGELHGRQGLTGVDQAGEGVGEGDGAGGLVHMDGVVVQVALDGEDAELLGVVADGHQAVAGVVLVEEADGQDVALVLGLLGGQIALGGLELDLAAGGVGTAHDLVGSGIAEVLQLDLAVQSDLRGVGLGEAVEGAAAVESVSLIAGGHGVLVGGLDGLGLDGRGAVDDLDTVHVEAEHIGDVEVADGDVDLSLFGEVGQGGDDVLILAGGDHLIGDRGHRGGIGRGAGIELIVLTGPARILTADVQGQAGSFDPAQIDGGRDGPVVRVQGDAGIGSRGDEVLSVIGVVSQALDRHVPVVAVAVHVLEGPAVGLGIGLEAPGVGRVLGGSGRLGRDVVLGHGGQHVVAADQAGDVVGVDLAAEADLAGHEVDEPDVLGGVVRDDQADRVGHQSGADDVVPVVHDVSHRAGSLIVQRDAGIHHFVEAVNFAGGVIDVHLPEDAGGGQDVVDIEAVVRRIGAGEGDARHIGQIAAQVPAIVVRLHHPAEAGGKQGLVLVQGTVAAYKGRVVGDVHGGIAGIEGIEGILDLSGQVLGVEGGDAALGADHVDVAGAGGAVGREGSRSLDVVGQAGQADGGEVVAALVADLRGHEGLDAGQALDGDRDLGADLIARGVVVHGGDRDGGGALADGGDQAGFVHGGDGLVAALHGELVGLAQLDLDAELLGLALIELDLGLVDLQAQVGGGGVLVQAGDGPDVLVEVAELGAHAGILGVNGVEDGGLAAAVVQGDEQEAALRVIDHGAPGLVGGIGSAGQVDAHAARLFHVQVAVHGQDEHIERAALGGDIVERAVLIFLGVVAASDVGDQRHGIGAEIVRQIEVDQAAGLGVDHGQIVAVIGRSDHAAHMTAADQRTVGVRHVGGQGVGVAGDPVADDAAQLGELIGVGIEGDHHVLGGAVDRVVHQSAPAELADLGEAFPLIGGVGAEDRGHALAFLVPDDAAQLGHGGLLDGHMDGGRQVRGRHGGDGDVRLADGDGLDLTLGVDGGDGRIRALEGDVLVLQGPGEDVGGDDAGHAAKQVHVLGQGLDAGGLGGRGDRRALAGHDDQTIQADAEGGIIVAAVDAVDALGLAVGGVDGPQVVVVVACGVVVGREIQGLRVVVPGQGAAVVVVVDAHDADGLSRDLLRLGLGLFDGLGLDLGTADLDGVDDYAVLVKAVVVTDGHIDRGLTREGGQVGGVGGQGAGGLEIVGQLGHIRDLRAGAGIQRQGLGVGAQDVSGGDGEGGLRVLAQVDGGRDGPVVGIHTSAADIGGGRDVGAAVPSPVVAVAVGINEGELRHGVFAVKVVAVDQSQILGLGFPGISRGQLELEQLGGAGVAVVGDVEGAVVVDGELVGDRVAAAHAVQGEDDSRGQLAGGQIHGVDHVVAAQHIELAVHVVVRHVIDQIDGIAVAADLLRVVQLADGGGIESAVGGGDEDIALDILGGADRDAGVGVDAHAVIGAGVGVVVQSGGIELDPAVAAAGRVGGGGGSQDQAAQVVGLRVAAGGELRGIGVAGVVADDQQSVGGQRDAAQIQRDLDGLAGLALLGHDAEVLDGAALVQHAHIGDVLVVLRLHKDVAADQVEEHALHLGRGVVHSDGVGDGRALAQDAGLDDGLEALGVEHAALHLVDGAVLLGDLHGVVLRQSIQTDRDGLALLDAHALQGLVDAEAAGAGVAPGAAVDVVVRGVDVAVDGAGADDLALRVGHNEGQGADVADRHVVEARDGVLAVHGQTVGGELILDGVGVAGVDHAGALSVLDGHVVNIGIRHVGQIAGAVELVDHAGVVKHRGIGPGAVEGQDGDGVGHVDDLTLAGAQALEVGEALDVGLAEVVVDEVGHVGIEEQVDLDAHGLVLDHDGGGGGRVEDLAGVRGGDVAVAVHVGRGQIQLSAVVLAGDVVQDGLGVGGVGVAVLIDVGLDGVVGRIELAVHEVVGVEVLTLGELGGGLILQDGVAGVSGDPLDEQVGGEVVLLDRVVQGVDGEAVAVDARFLGIVAQLGLDLAVAGGGREHGALFIHQDVAVGLDGFADVGHAGALLQDGPVVAVVVHQGDGGAHEQGVDELTLAQTGLGLELVLADVLTQDRGHACDLGRGHGGTAPGLVGVGAAGFAAALIVVADDGVDAAAGGGDLGLEHQGTGGAPGAEVAHGLHVGLLAQLQAQALGDAQGAGVVIGLAVLVHIHGRGLRQDGLAVGLVDGDAGSVELVAGQVHVDAAGLVVGDDDRHSTLGDGGVGLREEGARAAPADGDLAPDDVFAEGPEVVALFADVVIGFFVGIIRYSMNAGAVDEHILQLAQLGDAGDGRVAVAGGLIVEDPQIAEHDRHTDLAAVVHGGDGQAVGEGAGAAVGGIVHVAHVQIAVHIVVVGGVIPGVAVAGGHGDHHAVLQQAVHDVLVALGEGQTRLAGTEGQVGAVAAQDDGVLDGGHVVGIVSAAAVAEDLHRDELRVGGNALDADLGQRADVAARAVRDVAVGRGDTGDVGAVGALRVVLVGHVKVAVHVAVAVGDLGVDVGLGAHAGVELIADGGDVVRGHQQRGVQAVLLIGVEQGVGIEGLVIPGHAGVDDGDLAARAGVAGGPGGGGAGLDGGGAHVGLVRHLHGLVQLITVLDDDVLHAGDGADRLEIGVQDVGGNHVAREGDVPLHVQGLARGGLDAGGHGRLLRFQALTVGLGRGVARDVLQTEADFDGRSLLQHDGDAQNVGELVLFLSNLVFSDGVLLEEPQRTGVHRLQLDPLELVGVPPLRADHRDQHGEDESHAQHDGQHTLPIVIHAVVLLPLLCLQSPAAAPRYMGVPRQMRLLADDTN